MAWHKKQKILFSLLGLFLLINISILLIIFLEVKGKSPIYNMAVNGRIVKVEIVSSPYLQYLGLSKRSSLCADCGMLFKFNGKEEREFVMRDMNFSLDIIFIADGKIINIAEKLIPEGSKAVNIYKSFAPADEVLELNGGYSEKYGLKIGDVIKIIN